MHHGRLALSFVGTVGDRGSLQTERLTTPRVLGRWLRTADLCERDAVPSPALYGRALILREAIARSVAAVIAARGPAPEDIEIINDCATRLAPRPTLDPTTLALAGGRRGPVGAALGRIAIDAIEMFANPGERARLRACGLEACGAMFLTPAGHRERRWCSMARCGNRAKVTAFRRRTIANT
ncbi:MAG: ABATE domain-containing protein [Candidatus Eremiobacteraeota bacterium]|nr:ABATE domain-containing protein [Candidatus Eremiobacteraeota bacterium]